MDCHFPKSLSNITAKSINEQSVAAPSFDLQQIYIHQQNIQTLLGGEKTARKIWHHNRFERTYTQTHSQHRNWTAECFWQVSGADVAAGSGQHLLPWLLLQEEKMQPERVCVYTWVCVSDVMPCPQEWKSIQSGLEMCISL